ncbi:MAG TPA: transglycosylase domain-containing protein [Solirubrobacteraceae bacterium]|jgi:penicillin-binding protein 1A|nr:transglycosylase domain-containing protein [Solirubrobacteraceae bacterium]
MSVDNDILTGAGSGPAPIVFSPPERRRMLPRRRRGPKAPRPRVRKLRLLFVLSGFVVLAVISVLFGVLTSIASDLPKFENTVQFSHNVDSYMYDANGTPIGPLAPASTPAIDNWGQISQNMVHAIVSVEDHGFWSESGISVRGLIRAGLADATGGKIQGASTIPEEFIKNVRQEEGDRTVAEKLVEAGMAFQLSHHWSHTQILTEYLNTIYFGNGALGIEAAARTYFGWAHGYDPSNPADGGKNSCGDADPEHPHRPECASVLTPAQAALLAGIVANPSAFNPAGTGSERNAALQRRNLVLGDMYRQHYISYGEYQYSRNRPLPTPAQIQQPEQQPSAAPYFTSWVEPQVVRALEKEGLTAKEAQYEADYGGLKIKLSIDLNMQNEAQAVVRNELFSSPGLPSASLVAIDNKTGEVRAMVSGDGDYSQSPFNLATMGYRQPGSSFKIFTLAAAITKGYTPYSEFDSEPITIHFVKKGGNDFAASNGTGRFTVHNFGNEYSGLIPLTVATATSDNSVFAQLGTKIGTGAVKHYARLLGVRSPISTTPAMILGGLHTGVSALDMAHAYSTVANGGKKVYNDVLGDNGGGEGPIGIESISNCGECKQDTVTNKATMKTRQVISPEVASTIDELLHGPVDDRYGTGTAAAIPGVDVAGKTGTTSNYVDAWFVGWTPTMTVAVWVGYPDSGKPMTTDFNGGPVEGGDYPAIIWHDFMLQAIQIMDDENQGKKAATTSSPTTEETPTTYSGLSTSSSTQTSTGATQTSAGNATTNQNSVQTQPQNTEATQTPTNDATNNAGADTTPNESATVPATTPPPAAPTTTPSSGGNGGTGL